MNIYNETEVELSNISSDEYYEFVPMKEKQLNIPNYVQ